MADNKKKRSRKIPARYWLRCGAKTLTVIVHIIRIWLELGN
ncbi:hypothetical protein [Microbacterium sp. Root166]|nr:hypothetical protein [Microbacterium sp. Root166]